ncbi:putative T7SS-secreted protein [Saccharopolyspora sp. NPDC047091]|uniref:putative T7SS-secreted protein n=1 Tax=Saccharopolyspora sp. NPDC047091 TaxID=3155924 RepID=UPI0033C215D7
MAAELGDTDDPTELVPGDVAGTKDKADTFRRIADGLAAVQRIDSEHAWSGPAAEAYRKTVRDEQQRWDVAAAAFGKAATALVEHAEYLRTAQEAAARAIELYRQGEQETARAEKAHAAQVEAAGPADQVAPFQDPGAAKTAEARILLNVARGKFGTSGVATADALKAAAENAPDSSFLERMMDAFRGSGGALFEAGKSYAGGGLGALGEMAMGGLGLAAKPMHLITDPAATISAGFAAGAGVVHMITTKEGWGQTIGTLDEWKKDPAAALGKAGANIAATVAGGGAGAASKAGLAARVAKVAKHAPEPELPKAPPRPTHDAEGYTLPTEEELQRAREKAARPDPEPEPEPEPPQRETPPEPGPRRGHPEDLHVLDPFNPDKDPIDFEPDPPKASEPPPLSLRAAREDLQRAEAELKQAKLHEAWYERNQPESLPEHRKSMSELTTRIAELEARLGQ